MNWEHFFEMTTHGRAFANYRDNWDRAFAQTPDSVVRENRTTQTRRPQKAVKPLAIDLSGPHKAVPRAFEETPSANEQIPQSTEIVDLDGTLE